MSIAAVKIKIMPSSPETDITHLQEKVKEMLEKESVKNPIFQQEPIAFGLKALIVLFGWPEDKTLETFEETLSKVEGISSVEVIDIRRAIG